MMLVTTTAGVTGSEPLLPGKYESNGFIIWHLNSNEQTIDDINGDDSDRSDIDGDERDVGDGVIEACWSIGGNWGVMSHTGDSCIDEHNTW